MPKNFRLNPVPALCLLLVTVVLIIVLFETFGHPQSIPRAITRQVNFPVYYPNTMPEGYSLDKSSPRVDHQIIFFNINDQDRKISISEEAAPAVPPNFSTLEKYNPSFKSFESSAGKTIAGIDPVNQKPIAIIETNTTLISVAGTKNTPLDAITELAQSLSSLPR